jgi:histone H3/H4
MTVKRRCGACKKAGHDRGDCPVLKAGEEVIAKEEREERSRKDMAFHVEEIRRIARAQAVERIGEDAVLAMEKDMEQHFNDLLNIGRSTDIVAIKPGDVSRFIDELDKSDGTEEGFVKAIAAADGIRLGGSEPAETTETTETTDWARRGRDKGLN